MARKASDKKNIKIPVMDKLIMGCIFIAFASVVCFGILISIMLIMNSF